MDKDASTIRQEIELTRERMGDTVEALGYKADVPARMKDDVKQRVEAAKGTMSDVVDKVKATVTAAGEATADASRNQTNALSQVSGNIRDRVGELNSTISDRVGELNSTVSDHVGELNSAISGRAGEFSDAMSDRLQNADVPGSARRAIGAIQENPIGLALAALSLGFLSGSLLPISEIERERLAPIRSKIVDQAQATASDVVEAGKAVALETAQSAVNSAQSHGQEVVDAAKARAALH